MTRNGPEQARGDPDARPFGWHEAKRQAQKIAGGDADPICFEWRAVRWQLCDGTEPLAPDGARILLQADETTVAVEALVSLDGSLAEPCLTWYEGARERGGVWQREQDPNPGSTEGFEEGLRRLAARYRVPPLIRAGEGKTGPVQKDTECPQKP